MEKKKTRKILSSLEKALHCQRTERPPESKLDKMHGEYQSVRNNSKSFTQKSSLQRSNTSRRMVGQKGLKISARSNNILKDIINSTQPKRIQIHMDKQCLYNEEQSKYTTKTSTVKHNKVMEDISPINEKEKAEKDNKENVEEFMMNSVERKDDQSAITQKQQLMSKLDECQGKREKYKQENMQVSEEWEALFKTITSANSIKSIIQLQKQQIDQTQNHMNNLKTRLFQLNMEMLQKRKFNLPKNRQAQLLEQAEHLHQSLKNQLPKQNYQEILFCQKVVLSGESHPSFYSLYMELFEKKLVKKLSLIVKKEVSHLSHYDRKLIEGFLKQLHDIEGQYHKRQCSQKKSHEIEGYFDQTEELIVEIENANLKLQNKKAEAKKLQQNLENLKEEQKIHQLNINKYISIMSEKISTQYLKTEGETFDFKAILSNKYDSIREEYFSLLTEKQQLQNQLRGFSQN